MGSQPDDDLGTGTRAVTVAHGRMVLDQTQIPRGRRGENWVPPHDPVNNPEHYTTDPSGIECIQITRHRNFNVGNAIKYLWRAGLKNKETTIQDLEKAMYYINDEINRLKGTRP